jgi:hypothetical protein
MIDPPPADRSIAYRLSCTLISGRVGIGGVLYLARGELIFIAHNKNKRNAPKIDVTPVCGVSLSLVDPPPLKAFQRLLTPHPTQQIKLTWPGGRCRLIVPDLVGTSEKIRCCLEELRREP